MTCRRGRGHASDHRRFRFVGSVLCCGQAGGIKPLGLTRPTRQGPASKNAVVDQREPNQRARHPEAGFRRAAYAHIGFVPALDFDDALRQFGAMRMAVCGDRLGSTVGFRRRAQQALQLLRIRFIRATQERPLQLNEAVGVRHGGRRQRGHGQRQDCDCGAENLRHDDAPVSRRARERIGARASIYH